MVFVLLVGVSPFSFHLHPGVFHLPLISSSFFPSFVSALAITPFLFTTFQYILCRYLAPLQLLLVDFDGGGLPLSARSVFGLRFPIPLPMTTLLFYHSSSFKILHITALPCRPPSSTPPWRGSRIFPCWERSWSPLLGLYRFLSQTGFHDTREEILMYYQGFGLNRIQRIGRRTLRKEPLLSKFVRFQFLFFVLEGVD